MSRYKNIDIVKKEGIRKYTNTIVYPISNPRVDDIYIITKDGDRLDNLAYEYYKDPTLWWIIARANNFQGRTKFTVGQKLVIPMDIGDVVKQLNKLNTNV